MNTKQYPENDGVHASVSCNINSVFSLLMQSSFWTT